MASTRHTRRKPRKLAENRLRRIASKGPEIKGEGYVLGIDVLAGSAWKFSANICRFCLAGSEVFISQLESWKDEKGGVKIMTFLVIVIGIGLVLWIGGMLAGNHFEGKIENIVNDEAIKADKLVGGIDGFVATSVTKYVIGQNLGGFMYIDTNALQICVVPFGSEKYKIFKPADILDVKIVEDNSTISETKIGGQVGRAVVGGVLFGNVGAVVGGLSSNKKNSVIVDNLQVVIHFNDFDCHTIILNCLAGINVKRNSPEHIAAINVSNSWYGMLNVFANRIEVGSDVG